MADPKTCETCGAALVGDEDAQRALVGGGEPIRWRAEMLVKAAAEDTGGAFSLLETVTAPGGGPPLHLHDRVDEAFYVLDGTYEFVCGDRWRSADPGRS